MPTAYAMMLGGGGGLKTSRAKGRATRKRAAGLDPAAATKKAAVMPLRTRPHRSHQPGELPLDRRNLMWAGHDGWGRELFSGVAILSLVIGSNFAGDGLLDPHAW
jgi:hypothetical protein